MSFSFEKVTCVYNWVTSKQRMKKGLNFISLKFVINSLSPEFHTVISVKVNALKKNKISISNKIFQHSFFQLWCKLVIIEPFETITYYSEEQLFESMHLLTISPTALLPHQFKAKTKLILFSASMELILRVLIP